MRVHLCQAPETLGSQRIFFRDQTTNELKTVALTVENRAEVTHVGVRTRVVGWRATSDAIQ